MKDIQCPNCGTTFQVDDSTYESIVAQVRSKTFDAELRRRMTELSEQYKAQEQTLRAEMQTELIRLQGLLANHDNAKAAELSRLEAQKARELFDAMQAKDKEIADLRAQLSVGKSEHKLQIMEEKAAAQASLQQKDRELSDLRAVLRADKLMAEKNEAQLREAHRQQLQDKQEEIDRLKDFKLRLSTKMVGESLEQHCLTQFAEAQSMGQFPGATFVKDNIAVERSKGDFIFRDYISGDEYVSIMFEMKNEMDATATKHRNEDFFEKLHKDRENKHCEYAVLVSMLEQGNPLYDNGIVDMSFRYPKMIVIRPQFFLPVLRIITEAAKKGYLDRYALVQELEMARSQSRDFTKFEDRMNKFKETFSKNVLAAHKKFAAATDGIDKTIDALETQIKKLREIKANFEESERRLLKADEVAAESLTVKKLTHGAPSIRKLIEDA